MAFNINNIVHADNSAPNRVSAFEQVDWHDYLLVPYLCFLTVIGNRRWCQQDGRLSGWSDYGRGCGSYRGRSLVVAALLSMYTTTGTGHSDCKDASSLLKLLTVRLYCYEDMIIVNADHEQFKVCIKNLLTSNNPAHVGICSMLSTQLFNNVNI